MFETGYLTLFRVRRVPVRVHWSLPVGVLLFSGFRFAPGLWVSIVLLILAHELGHAFLVHRAGVANLGIELTGFGGLCRYAGNPSPKQRALIAWGGVLAQLLLLLVTGVVVLITGWPALRLLDDFVYGMVHVNLTLMAINLIPIRPLDGAQAWPLFGHLFRDHKRKREWKRRLTKEPKQPQTLREALRDADERPN